MSIVENRKAPHDYFIEERYEAGLELQGWEVKAIRAGRAQLNGDTDILIRRGPDRCSRSAELRGQLRAYGSETKASLAAGLAASRTQTPK